jgi:IrrE N-terminal-like domain
VLDEFARISAHRTSQDIARLRTDRLPVDLLAIAGDVGVSVDYDAVFNDDPTTSGSIQRSYDRSGPQTYLIRINGRDPEVRKRFTLAHELAHFLLHKDDLDRADVVDSAMYRIRP